MSRARCFVLYMVRDLALFFCVDIVVRGEGGGRFGVVGLLLSFDSPGPTGLGTAIVAYSSVTQVQ